MSSLVDYLKEYWWLVAGIAGAIAWLVGVILKTREINQKDDELYIEDRDSFFWKGVGIVWTAALIYSFLNSSEDQQKGKDRG